MKPTIWWLNGELKHQAAGFLWSVSGDGLYPRSLRTTRGSASKRPRPSKKPQLGVERSRSEVSSEECDALSKRGFRPVWSGSFLRHKNTYLTKPCIFHGSGGYFLSPLRCWTRVFMWDPQLGQLFINHRATIFWDDDSCGSYIQKCGTLW